LTGKPSSTLADVAETFRKGYIRAMPREHFRRVDVWVFDLDNTLYPPEIRLFDQIEVRMTRYVMTALGVEADRASHLRDHYWRTYGTTLAGLMAEHALDPEPYLAEVHDIDLTAVPEAPELAAAIAALPGRKVVYTNGSREHARRVTRARGIAGVFDAVYGFEDAGYVPKPREEAFARVFGTDGLAPDRAAMFEDDSRNLTVPHALGMRTVLVAPAPEPAEHVHHHTDDLADFLTRVR
jgi:putative hydrolase of the HAD superfamily